MKADKLIWKPIMVQYATDILYVMCRLETSSAHTLRVEEKLRTSCLSQLN